MASTVSELKKEIYDDEIYTREESSHNQSKEAKEIEQALEALSGEELTLEGKTEFMISYNEYKRVAQGPNFDFEGSYWTVLDLGGLFND